MQRKALLRRATEMGHLGGEPFLQLPVLREAPPPLPIANVQGFWVGSTNSFPWSKEVNF